MTTGNGNGPKAAVYLYCSICDSKVAGSNPGRSTFR